MVQQDSTYVTRYQVQEYIIENRREREASLGLGWRFARNSNVNQSVQSSGEVISTERRQFY